MPTETSSIASRPVAQFSLYGAAVAIRNSWKAGVLNAVTPPSTKMCERSPIRTTSGAKKVGAAVLARTSCHRGRSRFEPLSTRLNVASGLLLRHHGEFVEALRSTSISSVRSRSLPSVVSAPNTARNRDVRRSSRNLYRNRSRHAASVNISRLLVR